MPKDEESVEMYVSWSFWESLGDSAAPNAERYMGRLIYRNTRRHETDRRSL